MSQQPKLTVDAQKFNDVFNEHLRAEFNANSTDEAIATMTANPLVFTAPKPADCLGLTISLDRQPRLRQEHYE